MAPQDGASNAHPDVAHSLIRAADLVNWPGCDEDVRMALTALFQAVGRVEHEAEWVRPLHGFHSPVQLLSLSNIALLPQVTENPFMLAVALLIQRLAAMSNPNPQRCARMLMTCRELFNVHRIRDLTNILRGLSERGVCALLPPRWGAAAYALPLMDYYLYSLATAAHISCGGMLEQTQAFDELLPPIMACLVPPGATTPALAVACAAVFRSDTPMLLTRVTDSIQGLTVDLQPHELFALADLCRYASPRPGLLSADSSAAQHPAVFEDWLEQATRSALFISPGAEPVLL